MSPRSHFLPSMTMRYLILLIAALFCAVDALVVDDCPDQASRLEECAIVYGAERIVACFGCVDESVNTTADTCELFETVFCSNINTTCDTLCYEGSCGDVFLDFVNCAVDTEASKAGLNNCNVTCPGIFDGTTNNTDSRPTGILPASCKNQETQLGGCLAGNGRSNTDLKNCYTCMNGTFANNFMDCRTFSEAFCSILPNCDTACAKAACASEYLAAGNCTASNSLAGCIPHCLSTSDAATKSMLVGGILLGAMTLLEQLL